MPIYGAYLILIFTACWIYYAARKRGLSVLSSLLWTLVLSLLMASRNPILTALGFVIYSINLGIQSRIKPSPPKTIALLCPKCGHESQSKIKCPKCGNSLKI